MYATKEDIITLKALAGTSTISASKQVEAGRILGVVCYKSAADNNNPGMVNAEIKDVSGKAVSMMQHIDNYRSREAGYIDGSKPLPISGGQVLDINIVASANFTADTQFQFIFIYDQTENC